MDLGPHAIFIWLCYGVVALVLVVMMAGLWLEGRRLGQDLARLDNRRSTTHSAEPAGAAPVRNARNSEV